MPRKRRLGIARRVTITPEIQRILEVGRHRALRDVQGDQARSIEIYFVTVDALEGLWVAERDELLASWVAANAGTRPWAWWRWSAGEPRRVVRGRELLVKRTGKWWWRDHFGEPS